jgi:hypothetical protein
MPSSILDIMESTGQAELKETEVKPVIEQAIDTHRSMVEEAELTAPQFEQEIIEQEVVEDPYAGEYTPVSFEDPDFDFISAQEAALEEKKTEPLTIDKINPYYIQSILNDYKEDFSSMNDTVATSLLKATVHRANPNWSVDYIDDKQVLRFFKTNDKAEALEKAYYLTQQSYGEDPFTRWNSLPDDSDSKFDTAKEAWLKQAAPGQSIDEDELYTWYTSKNEYNLANHAAVLSIAALDKDERRLYYRLMTKDNISQHDAAVVAALPPESQQRVYRALGANNPERLDGGILSIGAALSDGALSAIEGMAKGVLRFGTLNEAYRDKDSSAILVAEYRLNQLTANVYLNDTVFADYSRKVASVVGDLAVTTGLTLATGGVGAGILNATRFTSSVADKLQFEYGMDADAALAWGTAAGTGMALIEQAQLSTLVPGIKSSSAALKAAKAGTPQVVASATRKQLLEEIAKRQLSPLGSKTTGKLFTYIKSYMAATSREQTQESLQSVIEAGVSTIAVLTDDSISAADAEKYMRNEGTQLLQEIKDAFIIMPVITAAGSAVNAGGRAYNRNKINNLIVDALESGDQKRIAMTAAALRGFDLNQAAVENIVSRRAKDSFVEAPSVDTIEDLPSEIDIIDIDKATISNGNIVPSELQSFFDLHKRLSLDFDIMDGTSDSLKVAYAEFGSYWEQSNGDPETFIESVVKDNPDVSKGQAAAISEMLTTREQIIRDAKAAAKDVPPIPVDATQTVEERNKVYDTLVSEAVEEDISTIDIPTIKTTLTDTIPGVELTDIDNGVNVKLPNGKDVDVVTIDSTAQDVQGIYSGDLIILNEKGADASTVLHEIFHKLEDVTLSDSDIKVLEERGLDTADKRAEAFSDYHLKGIVEVEQEVEKSIWDKIVDFLTPWKAKTVEQVFEKATKARASKRQVTSQSSFQDNTTVSTAYLHGLSIALAHELDINPELDTNEFIDNILSRNNLRVSGVDRGNIKAQGLLLLNERTNPDFVDFYSSSIDMQIEELMSPSDSIVGIAPSPELNRVINQTKVTTSKAKDVKTRIEAKEAKLTDEVAGAVDRIISNLDEFGRGRGSNVNKKASLWFRNSSLLQKLRHILDEKTYLQLKRDLAKANLASEVSDARVAVRINEAVSDVVGVDNVDNYFSSLNDLTSDITNLISGISRADATNTLNNALNAKSIENINMDEVGKAITYLYFGKTDAILKRDILSLFAHASVDLSDIDYSIFDYRTASRDKKRQYLTIKWLKENNLINPEDRKVVDNILSAYIYEGDIKYNPAVKQIVGPDVGITDVTLRDILDGTYTYDRGVDIFTKAHNDITDYINKKVFSDIKTLLDSIFENTGIREQVINTFGKGFYNATKAHAADTANQTRKSAKHGYLRDFRSWFTLSTMWMNVRSAVLQLTSVPVAYMGGLKTEGSGFFASDDTIKFLEDTFGMEDVRKSRGYSIDIADADVDLSNLSGVKKRVAQVKKFLRRGVLSSWGDYEIFKHVVGSEYEASMKSQEDAYYNTHGEHIDKDSSQYRQMQNLAYAEGLDAAHETQQSSRIDKLGDFQRDEVGALLTTFRTTPLLQTRLLTNNLMYGKTLKTKLDNLKKDPSKNKERIAEVEKEYENVRKQFKKDVGLLIAQQVLYYGSVVLFNYLVFGDEPDEQDLSTTLLHMSTIATDGIPVLDQINEIVTDSVLDAIFEDYKSYRWAGEGFAPIEGGLTKLNRTLDTLTSDKSPGEKALKSATIMSSAASQLSKAIKREDK